MPITSFYASILAALFLWLSFRVIARRRHVSAAFGDGNDSELLQRARTHGNFAEYAPIALILLACAESLATPAIVLHAIGILLVAGRFVHALALSFRPQVILYRVLGMSLTFTAIAIALAVTILMSIAQLTF